MNTVIVDNDCASEFVFMVVINHFLTLVFTSLFAAQAGASRVIAIEASEKMAAVATQVSSLHL